MPSRSINLRDWLASDREPSVLLLDGGVSTYLESLLANRNESFSNRALWSSSCLLDGQDEDILECHSAFAAAGADIISTVTYQCHFGIGGDRQLSVHEDTMSCMIRKGIHLAKRATKMYVAASLGCYGASLADGSEYRGDYEKSVTRATLRDFHRRRINVVAPELPDAIAFETVPNIEEVAVLAELSRNSAPIPAAVWISLACCNDHQLNDGSELELVLDELRKIDPEGDAINAVGFNCCPGKYVSSLLKILTRDMAINGPKRGIVFYPNSGEEWDSEKAIWLEGSGCTEPETFARALLEGIKVVEQTWARFCVLKSKTPKIIVGGCCRTSPTTIAALRRLVDERGKDND